MILNKKTIVLIFCLVSISFVAGQNMINKGITTDMLQEFSDSLRLDSADTALINALTNNELHKLALNRAFLKMHNNLFSNRIETKGITDQKNSGRCWIFAGLNVLRSKVIKKYNLKEFEFSQSYISFWDKLEKANFVLEFVIQTRDRDLRDRELDIVIDNGVQDGGYWYWFVELIEKYGVVPKQIFPETYPSSNTWLMTQLINEQILAGADLIRKMAEDGVDEDSLRKIKFKVLNAVYKMLVMTFTEPPEKFIWVYEDKDGKIIRSKKYTPLQFYEEVIGGGLRDYVSLIHYPGRDFNRLYQFDNCRNVFDASDPRHANVDIGMIKEMVKKSILENEPVWFACDIGKESYGDKGILSSQIFDYDAIFRPEFKMDKEARIFYRFSTANHAMALLGVDIQDGKPVKWFVENSHGADEGEGGYYSMYDDWFDEYVYEVIINKKYLPSEIKKIFEQKPIHLPIWDPMAELLLVR